jgi:hypothetical protein
LTLANDIAEDIPIMVSQFLGYPHLTPAETGDLTTKTPMALSLDSCQQQIPGDSRAEAAKQQHHQHSFLLHTS